MTQNFMWLLAETLNKYNFWGSKREHTVFAQLMTKLKENDNESMVSNVLSLIRSILSNGNDQ